MTSASRYAKRTVVPIARSRQEIQDLLERHHATAFGFLQLHLRRIARTAKEQP